jgi:hypothetical protein
MTLTTICVLPTAATCLAKTGPGFTASGVSGSHDKSSSVYPTFICQDQRIESCLHVNTPLLV